MSEAKYYSVQIIKRMEVCVLARDEHEAEECAREASFSWDFADVEDATASEEYNGGEEDAENIAEFKNMDRYAEACEE